MSDRHRGARRDPMLPSPARPPRGRIVCGDAIDVLSAQPAGSVQTCVTSPPYWGLRDYGVAARIWRGGGDCRRHRWGSEAGGGAFCQRCDAWRGPLGLEPNPDLYVDHLLTVLREVRRVLREDGTLWLVVGDSYAANPIAGDSAKPKDLIGIPWRIALALQADGWWLRSDVIWAKTNPSPEPIRDRPAHTHEHVFLLAPSRSYFYDAIAVREPNQDRQGRGQGGRNRRSVWPLPTANFSGEHFAAFPEALAEPCILAGTSPTACALCGAPWRRVVSARRLRDGCEVRGDWTDDAPRLRAGRAMRAGVGHSRIEVRHETLGWEATCEHDAPGGHCTVLDPFAGTGTTGLVAVNHGRDFIGVELSGAYARAARTRLRREANR